MISPVNPNMAATFAPPVMAARVWLEGVEFPGDRPLINVSQAAPAAPPPEPLRKAMAEIAMTRAEAHLYGPVLGLPALREAIAARFSAAYEGRILPGQVAITSGCNQAFTAALSTLAAPGDEVIIPTPWYFNHKMHLTMAGVRAVALPVGKGMLPEPDRARTLIGPNTKAIVLVSPNNPTGAHYPPSLLRAFFELAREHGIALVLDETYRDFDSRPAPAHDLFHDPGWPQTLIQLYSFSKAYRLTGHRVGTLVASCERLEQAEKYLDTVSICPNQLAQHAALWGIGHLDNWLAGQRREILARRQALEAGFAPLMEKGWQLRGAGAYFAYLEHPFAESSQVLAPKLVRAASLLMLPGTMFRPPEETQGAREMRIAFANIDTQGITTMLARLENLPPDLAPPRQGA